MRAIRRFMIPVFSMIFLAILLVCRKSPFSNEIEDRRMEIRGRLKLDGTNNYEGIYVWLETINISTFTDSTGLFRITLPSITAKGSLVGMNGVFQLYFYVANYKISSATAVMLDGEFQYSTGDFDSNGEIIGRRTLRKLLNIETDVKPNIIAAANESQLSVTVTLRALLDSVNVIFPRITGRSPGAVILRELETGDIIVELPDISSPIKGIERIGREAQVFRMVFELISGTLKQGQYETIPFFMIEQENIPEALIESLIPSSVKLGPDYLNIPFRREGGFFLVVNNF